MEISDQNIDLKKVDPNFSDDQLIEDNDEEGDDSDNVEVIFTNHK